MRRNGRGGRRRRSRVVPADGDGVIAQAMGQATPMDMFVALLAGHEVAWTDFATSNQAFARTCDAHHLTCLVERCVRNMSEGLWPDEVRDALTAGARAAIARELLLEIEIRDVLSSLDR